MGWIVCFNISYGENLTKKKKALYPKALQEIKTSLEKYCKIQESDGEDSQKEQQIIDCIPEFSVGRPGLFNINQRRFNEELKINLVLTDEERYAKGKQIQKAFNGVGSGFVDTLGFIVSYGFEEEMSIVFVPRSKGTEIEIHSDTAGRTHHYLIYTTITLICLGAFILGYGYVKDFGAGSGVNQLVFMGIGASMAISLILAYLDKAIRKIFRLLKINKGFEKLNYK